MAESLESAGTRGRRIRVTPLDPGVLAPPLDPGVLALSAEYFVPWDLELLTA